jgi:hypothetical protein
LDHHDPVCPETVIINEVQLLLSEKRTSLAAMRTGIAVFALPLTVMSVSNRHLKILRYRSRHASAGASSDSLCGACFIGILSDYPVDDTSASSR